jgi:predicted porin
MMEVLMMKKFSIGALLVAMAVVMAGPAQAAFTVGGENGWSLSTDGIVNIFGIYQTTEIKPDGAFSLSLLNNNSDRADQKFGVRVGLLPSIIALNVKAPTVAGIDSNVRVAMYPNNQNNRADNARFETAPNIDFREFFYTASGNFGSFMAGRGLNLFQGQNILNDMCLFTAGVADMSVVRGGTSLGHIAYGYLYTNFGPQFRYTTPDMGGVKVALEIAEPYAISSESIKQNIPRFETEISYATTFKGGSIHAWLEGLWQQDTNNLVAPDGSFRHNTSLGIAPGVNVAVGPVGIMLSGYYGRGLGMVSAQDGGAFASAALNDGPVDSDGKERKHWGFLAHTTFQVTDSIRLGANYGRSDMSGNENHNDDGIKKTQEAAVAQMNFNLNKFTQFTLEYIWARDSWFGVDQKQTSHQVALGTVFFW